MESSLCSSFVPGSSVVPGGAWTPLPLSPAALPSEGPAALLAGQTKRLNSVMWCLRRLMKFTVTWSFSGYILAVILHVTGLCSSARQHWSYLEVCGLPFQPLVAETAGFLAIHFEQIPALYKRWKGLHFKPLPKKKKVLFTFTLTTLRNLTNYLRKIKDTVVQRNVSFFHPRNTNSEISPQYLMLLVMSWAVNAEIPKFLQMHFKNDMFLTCSSVET